MKITVSKHTTIDWQLVKNEIALGAAEAVDELVTFAQEEADKLLPGNSITISRNVGKITIRRSKD